MSRPDHTVAISPSDLYEMRQIFDAAEIARPRHCFRWNATLGRWELSEVAPVDRTLKAYLDDNGDWQTV